MWFVGFSNGVVCYFQTYFSGGVEGAIVVKKNLRLPNCSLLVVRVNWTVRGVIQFTGHFYFFQFTGLVNAQQQTEKQQTASTG